MATKILYILILLFSKIGLSQNQIGFGISTGLGDSFEKKEYLESPKNTIITPIVFGNIQYKLEFNILRNNFLYDVNFQFNSFTLDVLDKSKNIIFFPDLSSKGGTRLTTGGRAKTISFSFGKYFSFKKEAFCIQINMFGSKFRKEFSSMIGLKVKAENPEGIIYKWSFYLYKPNRYYNNLLTFGFGLKLKYLHSFFNSNRLKFQTSLEINKGFLKITEKTYRTQFISYIEPEKNATYYNTISTKGSNIQFYVGLVYFLKKKDK